jgi:hypothetical protein
MNKKSSLIAFLLLGSLCCADEESNKTIHVYGVQKGNPSNGVPDQAYLSTVEPLANPSCSYGTLYFTINSDFGKSALASIMTAKMNGTIIKRLKYSLNAGDGLCYLSFLEFGN